MCTKYDFKNKVALITGSSSGIGAATAILFAKSGAQVVITGRNVNKLDKVCTECTHVSPNGLKAVPVVADVTKEADLDRLLTTTIDSFGKLDILVNNVGSATFSLDMFTKCLAVELGPKRIRVNSVSPGCVYTDAFKNSNLAMTEAEGRAIWDKIAANYPVGRMGESVDVANAVAFLASDQASFITGTNLLIDGGHIAANIQIDI
ncbi:unnamed protein product [Medioppia subpectinata]|uniref:Uncharacterized protein n=1 Tax=Medioppia subpectinata TaxID=1979941 RepID=A0A7R9PXX2_9ACAR|nr:unnamed protein product [Medioppia subpectinata]CAG2105254.1 unnamed protein product [Medioppia subpectinata]